MNEKELLRDILCKYSFTGWLKSHSINAASIISVIEKCENDLLSNRLVIGALLHDIGRINNIKGSKHTIEGYKILENYDVDLARYCITHSYPTQNANDYQGLTNCDRHEIIFMNNILEKMDENDKKIILADCYASADGIISLKRRFCEFDKRYPVSNVNELKLRKRIREAYKKIENEVVGKYEIDIQCLSIKKMINQNRDKLVDELDNIMHI